MRNPTGYCVVTGPYGEEHKEDTFKCAHGQHIVSVPPGADPNEFFCVSCFKPICAECKKKEWNRPAGIACSYFERRIEEYENRHRFRREIDQGKEWWGVTPFE